MTEPRHRVTGHRVPGADSYPTTRFQFDQPTAAQADPMDAVYDFERQPPRYGTAPATGPQHAARPAWYISRTHLKWLGIFLLVLVVAVIPEVRMAIVVAVAFIAGVLMKLGMAIGYVFVPLIEEIKSWF